MYLTLEQLTNKLKAIDSKFKVKKTKPLETILPYISTPNDVQFGTYFKLDTEFALGTIKQLLYSNGPVCFSIQYEDIISYKIHKGILFDDVLLVLRNHNEIKFSNFDKKDSIYFSTCLMQKVSEITGKNIPIQESTSESTDNSSFFFHPFFIFLLLLLSPVTSFFSGVIGVILAYLKYKKIINITNSLEKENNDFKQRYGELEEKYKALALTKEELEHLDLINEKNNLLNEISDLKVNYENEKSQMLIEIQKEYTNIFDKRNQYYEDCKKYEDELEKLIKQTKTSENKVRKLKAAYTSVEETLRWFKDKFLKDEYGRDDLCKLPFTSEELNIELEPEAILHLHAMDIRELKKAYRENQKHIDQLLERYKGQYTTKANAAIYSLMVLALKAEIQNILYNLKFEKMSEAIDRVRSMTEKYLKISSDGNQTISSTLMKFIGEIEFFFKQAVEIEYEYWVRKEQARQEQIAIREQMRQEAAERKELERQRKQIEIEEEKFKNEIQSLEEQKSLCDNEEKMQLLENKIKELTKQLSEVESKKEDIINLQNGKAGNVYIISNIGSFGENVFKIGMTRRLNPIERVNELGSASVPFKFDVHSFIFSEDAVSLENKLHTELHKNRVNKINFRKEFFKIPINELEELVTAIDPAAEFNTTILAEEFKQTLSLIEEGANLNYDPSLHLNTSEDEEEDLEDNV